MASASTSLLDPVLFRLKITLSANIRQAVTLCQNVRDLRADLGEDGIECRIERAARATTSPAVSSQPLPERAVFLSYASENAEPARRICDALREYGPVYLKAAWADPFPEDTSPRGRGGPVQRRQPVGGPRTMARHRRRRDARPHCGRVHGQHRHPGLDRSGQGGVVAAVPVVTFCLPQANMPVETRSSRETAVRRPEEFRTMGGIRQESTSGKLELKLRPYAVARVDIES